MHDVRETTTSSNALHVTCRGRQEQRVMHHMREMVDINIK